MKIIYAKERIQWHLKNESRIFLAGPTPRRSHGRNMAKSWRQKAIDLFRRYGYDGVLLIPEDRDGSISGSYQDQIEWEEKGLTLADCILFWIPREMKYMPALTTNDEWGTWKASKKVVLGTPPNAEKVRYQRYYAEKYNVPLSNTLEETVVNSLFMVNFL